jgi:catechol 2,3-dioxygenase-like lactoylglutathione lyase family enzyme
MAVVGIEEIFLDVADLDKAIDFYHGKLGIPIDVRNDERAYLQCERGHIVLQVKGHSGRHRGGGPLHFALTVSEDTFDEVVENVVGAAFFTRGPMGERGKGRTLFMFDPDGNETEVNTRYLYGVPKR